MRILTAVSALALLGLVAAAGDARAVVIVVGGGALILVPLSPALIQICILSITCGAKRTGTIRSKVYVAGTVLVS